ncbi:hypothetical protein QE453_000798 [Agrobacterium sp. SORGH_AS440]|nr:hypothetical protein [Agrobacterium sp. SORGH_AS_0440]
MPVKRTFPCATTGNMGQSEALRRSAGTVSPRMNKVLSLPREASPSRSIVVKPKGCADISMPSAKPIFLRRPEIAALGAKTRNRGTPGNGCATTSLRPATCPALARFQVFDLIIKTSEEPCDVIRSRKRCARLTGALTDAHQHVTAIFLIIDQMNRSDLTERMSDGRVPIPRRQDEVRQQFADRLEAGLLSSSDVDGIGEAFICDIDPCSVPGDFRASSRRYSKGKRNLGGSPIERDQA